MFTCKEKAGLFTYFKKIKYYFLKFILNKMLLIIIIYLFLK